MTDLVIIRGEQPPTGVWTLPVPFAPGHEPSDAELKQGYRMVRKPGGRVWVWANTKCGYACYEVVRDE